MTDLKKVAKDRDRCYHILSLLEADLHLLKGMKFVPIRILLSPKALRLVKEYFIYTNKEASFDDHGEMEIFNIPAKLDASAVKLYEICIAPHLLQEDLKTEESNG